MSSGWANTWDDILSGGNPRWKIASEECHEKAYSHFQNHVLKGENNDTKIQDTSVLCPLAGDDPFVYLLYKKGYNVTAIDLVAKAIEAMKNRFDDDDSCWTKEEESSSNDGTAGDVVWKHKSGRATFIVGDALRKRSNLNNSFDAVYDKDSFGALQKQLRKSFCQRISEYTKHNAILYLECKLKNGVAGSDDTGPPFSLQREDLMEDDNYGGSKFEYVEGLGRVYDLPGKFASMQQTGHILRRCRTEVTTA